MIWYRHWLEMRGGLLILAGMWLFVGFSNTGPFLSLLWDSWLLFPWQPFGQELYATFLGRAMGEDGFIWAEFAGRVLPFVFMATLVLAGNGSRSLLALHDRSVSYTLTLPVSRTRLLWTRLVAALMVIVLATLLALAAGCAILLVRGYSVPLIPVAQSLALGVVCAATTIAVTTALVTALRSRVLAFFAFMVLFVVTIVPISYTVAAPARGEVPWGPLTAFVAITALALAFTIFKTTTEDY